MPGYARECPIANGGATPYHALHTGYRQAVRGKVAGPVITLKGIGSRTCPCTGTRPTKAVMAVEPISVAFRGTVGIECLNKIAGLFTGRCQCPAGGLAHTAQQSVTRQWICIVLEDIQRLAPDQTV